MHRQNMPPEKETKQTAAGGLLFGTIAFGFLVSVLFADTELWRDLAVWSALFGVFWSCLAHYHTLTIRF